MGLGHRRGQVRPLRLETGVVIPMGPGKGAEVCHKGLFHSRRGPSQLLRSKLPHQTVQGVALGLLILLEQGVFTQRVQMKKACACHPGRGLWGKGAGKNGKGRQHLLLLGLQHGPRGLEGGPDAPMAGRHIPQVGAEHIQGAAQRVRDLGQGTAANPGRGQGDPQGQPFHLGADAPHLGQVLGGKGKRIPGHLGQGGEHLLRWPRGFLLALRQPRQPHHRLGLEIEGRARRGQDGQARCTAQPARDEAQRVQSRLAVVQDQEHLLVPQASEHLCAGQLPLPLAQPQGLANGNLHLLCAPYDAVQGDKPDAVSKTLRHLPADLQRQAGFANAPRPHQGDEPVGGVHQQVEQAALFGLPAKEGGGRRRQVAAAGRRRRRGQTAVQNLPVQAPGLLLRLHAQLLPQDGCAPLVLGQGGVAVAQMEVGLHDGPVRCLQPGLQGQLPLGRVQHCFPRALLPVRVPQPGHGLQRPLGVVLPLGQQPGLPHVAGEVQAGQKLPPHQGHGFFEAGQAGGAAGQPAMGMGLHPAHEILEADQIHDDVLAPAQDDLFPIHQEPGRRGVLILQRTAQAGEAVAQVGAGVLVVAVGREEPGQRVPAHGNALVRG